jgi:adenylate cyclase
VEDLDLSALLDELLDRPAGREEIERRLELEFAQTKAVVVVDLCGFSRTTKAHGVVTFLLMIHQMRTLARPVITAHDGVLVEAKADNLLCLFDSVGQALAASRAILQQLNTANLLLPEEFELYASIGIGHGRLLVLRHDLVAGHELNLASKLGEDIADRGQIYLTEAALADLDDLELNAKERTIEISGIETIGYLIEA